MLPQKTKLCSCAYNPNRDLVYIVGGRNENDRNHLQVATRALNLVFQYTTWWIVDASQCEYWTQRD